MGLYANIPEREALEVASTPVYIVVEMERSRAGSE